MSGLKLYFDAVSPVCRSVMLFLSMNGIPHEVVEISLKNSELLLVYVIDLESLRVEVKIVAGEN